MSELRKICGVDVAVEPDYIGFIACTDDYDGPGSPIGWGKTEQEAIKALCESLPEGSSCICWDKEHWRFVAESR